MSDNKNRTTGIKNDPFIITTGRFEPGCAEKFCKNTPDELSKVLAFAELSYYRGDTHTAHKEFQKLAESGTERVALAATL